MQTRAKNTARITELTQWQKLFEVYKASNGAYPSVDTGGYCLGSNFPVQNGEGYCRDYTYTDYNSNIQLVAAIDADSPTKCPAPTTGGWTNGSTTLCLIELRR